MDRRTGARTSTAARVAPDRNRSRVDNELCHHAFAPHTPWHAAHGVGDTDSERQCLYRDDGQYAVPSFGGAKQVFRYLGRYSHRVAIANSRLVALEDDQVFFRWKDYADDHRTKVMRLTADEFIRRFLLHVLPKRFVRIRHYGLLAGRNVGTKLARCRQLLGVPDTEQPVERAWLDRLQQEIGRDPTCCPRCQGPLTRQPLEATTTAPAPMPRAVAPWCGVDSS